MNVDVSSIKSLNSGKKENISVELTIGSQHRNYRSMLQRVEMELTNTLSTWTDSHSIYHCKSGKLIKKARDIGDVDTTNDNNGNDNENEIHLAFEMKAINWKDELCYIDNELMNELNDQTINDCETYLDFLINNCKQRIKIEKKLAVKKKKKSKKQEKKKKKKKKQKSKKLKSAKTENDNDNDDNNNDNDIENEEKELSVTPNTVSNDNKIASLDPIEMTKTHLDRLLKSLPNQGFVSNDEIVLNIKQSVTIAENNGKWDDIMLNLTNAIKKMRPFNVNVLYR